MAELQFGCHAVDEVTVGETQAAVHLVQYPKLGSKSAFAGIAILT